MASEVEIANRALQKLGAKRIASLTEDSVNGRACNALYSVIRDAELRAHTWNFAIKRVQLAKESTAPIFGRANSFLLPSDFLFLLRPDPELNNLDIDWQIEGRKIITDSGDPLDFRYIYRVEDPNEMDILFREAVSSKMAEELAEELTQSNKKKEVAKADYKIAINKAKKANAIERVAQKPPEDKWVTVRQ